MGLLDDLKRQADRIRTHDSRRRVLREDNIRAVDQAMHRLFHYVLDLFKQLDVVKPVNPHVYAIPGLGELKDLHYLESFVNSRKTKHDEHDVYENVDFFIKWGSDASLVVERDMPAAIEKVRDLLWSFNLKFLDHETRNEQGSLVRATFTIASALTVHFSVHADHDERRLLFHGKNSLRLGPDDFAVPADELSEAVLEELARMLLGRPSEFRHWLAVLKRV